MMDGQDFDAAELTTRERLIMRLAPWVTFVLIVLVTIAARRLMGLA